MCAMLRRTPDEIEECMSEWEIYMLRELHMSMNAVPDDMLEQ